MVRPALPRFENLVENSQLREDGASLHTSWLLVLIRRGIVHENVFVMRWATYTLLTLDLTASPVIEQDTDEVGVELILLIGTV